MDAPELRKWQGTAADTWRQRWDVPELHIFAAVPSTNDVARELAEAGAPEGTTVLADEQTHGRGRRGRVWESTPGESLTLSMVLRPRTLGAESILSLRLGLAAARAIESLTALAVGLKWPNDLMIGDGKVGGLLCEGVVEGDRVAGVVAGIGVNVYQEEEDWAGPLADRATSLAACGPRVPSIAGLAERVIAEWQAAAGERGDRLSTGELAAFERRDVLKGKAVRVDGKPAGTVLGVDADGALRLDQDGAVRRVVAGTVRTTESQG